MKNHLDCQDRIACGCTRKRGPRGSARVLLFGAGFEVLSILFDHIALEGNDTSGSRFNLVDKRKLDCALLTPAASTVIDQAHLSKDGGLSAEGICKLTQIKTRPRSAIIGFTCQFHSIDSRNHLVLG